MTSEPRLHVLVSELQPITGDMQSDNALPYLPYMWAVLKSYHERHSATAGAIAWHDPLWQSKPPSALLQTYGEVPVDVLGLSCYTWNWELQCALAEGIKEQNPDCLVVAGGPEPAYSDRSFFIDHPYIDAVVVKDGEDPFSRILEHVVAGNRDFRDIGGLYLPAANRWERSLYTGPAVVPTDFDYSPYVDQRAYYERLVPTLGIGNFNATLETNRGCPYGCSYCDWGSSTNSKVRRFDMERVEAELRWLASMQPDSLIIADANFGILPRDVQIAELLCRVRAEHDNYPRSIYWNTAKNNPDRAISIARQFAESGASPSFQLSIQNTDRAVLAATARSNISTEKQLQVVRALMEFGTPIEVQLIIGIPGDTYDSWKRCFADLMEWGIHEDYLVQLYQLLPNAPAADRAFLDQWQVRTIDRTLYDRLARDENAPHSGIPQKPAKVVVGASSYSSDDWVQMATYAAMVKSLHNAGLTQRIATYLRLTHGIGYQEFYDNLIDNHSERSETLNTLKAVRSAVEDHYERFLSEPDASDHMLLDEFPDLGWAVHPSRWAFVQTCMNSDVFYEELTHHLLETYPEIENLASVIEYQRDVLILPSYNRDAGKVVQTDFDWPGYFRTAAGREGHEVLAEPEATPGASLVMRDQAVSESINSAASSRPQQPAYFHVDLDWGSNSQNPWLPWIRKLVIGPARSSVALHNLSDAMREPQAITHTTDMGRRIRVSPASGQGEPDSTELESGADALEPTALRPAPDYRTLEGLAWTLEPPA